MPLIFTMRCLPKRPMVQNRRKPEVAASNPVSSTKKKKGWHGKDAQMVGGLSLSVNT